MTPRWWPLGLSLQLAAIDPEPAAAPATRHQPQPTGPRPLSWDAEDRAVAAARCPWHPDADFPDTTDLIRHVVGHARAWEAEAIHAERLRRAMVGRVQRYARDVVERANELGSRT